MTRRAAATTSAPTPKKKLPAAKASAAPAKSVKSAKPINPIKAAAVAAAEEASETGSRTQVERRAEAEARLLATARRLIARRGWAGTTLADVGEEAGYSRGLAGHYFGSKAGLLRAITEQINDTMMGEVRKAPATEPGLASILAFIGIYLSRKDAEWTNTRSLLNLMTHALLEGSEHADLMVNFNRSMFKYIEDQIRIGIEHGEIDPVVSPTVAAEFIIGTLRGVMLQRLVKGGEMQPAVLRRHLQTLVERSLRLA